MKSKYIIYCDESEASGNHCSNFYGGVLIDSDNHDKIEDALNKKKNELGIPYEMKWSSFAARDINHYKDLMDCFFSFIKSNEIKFRIMFTQNIYQPTNLTRYHHQHRYFILYYHFIKEAFGLRYANPGSIHINFDMLKIGTNDKKKKFFNFITNLSNTEEFKNSGITISNSDIKEVVSKDNIIMQCTDIILGAIQSKLNGKLENDDEHKYQRRGKKTKTKEELYKHINARIREVRPRFNIGNTTSPDGNLENIYRQAYRHWKFIPKDNELDLSRSKAAARERKKSK